VLIFKNEIKNEIKRKEEEEQKKGKRRRIWINNAEERNYFAAFTM